MTRYYIRSLQWIPICRRRADHDGEEIPSPAFSSETKCADEDADEIDQEGQKAMTSTVAAHVNTNAWHAGY